LFLRVLRLAHSRSIVCRGMAASRKGRGKGMGKSSGRGSKGAAAAGQEERSDHTLHFYSIDEVLSALQKAVRRGHARNAAFWAGELHVSGLTAIATKRLLIMTVEDVGIASPYAPFLAATAQALLLTMPEDGRRRRPSRPTLAPTAAATATAALTARPCRRLRSRRPA